MAGGRLGWYARRLRAMGPAEVAWRMRRLAVETAAPRLDPLRERLPGARALPDHADAASWERALAAFRTATDRPVLLDRGAAGTIAATAPAATADLLAAAERVAAHRFAFFAHPEVTLADPVDWHHDPLAGHDWPRVPARRLDHRTAPADVKWIWELNRLQHLPWLAEAWLLTGRDELAAEAFAQLDSWLDANPVGVGIAWRGAFEAGVRMISVLVALQGLRTSPLLTAERLRRVVVVADASARACWRERSLHSSANNHLVGELAGLAATCLLLPELPDAERRLGRALDALVREAGRQVLPDGAGAEQAVGYQVFTAELVLVVAVLLRASGRPVPAPLTDALTRSGTYLAGLVGRGDPEPRYGDDDEGFALRLGPEPVRTIADHLDVLAAYGAAPADLPPGAGLTARWVAAATTGSPGPTGLLPDAARDAGSFHAPHGGLVVLRPAAGERVTVDTGPLGYLAIAAHGHADALAVTWSVGGRDRVVDPGTGSYYGHPAWRRVHRGTAVHATVTVDGEDQSVMAGAFLWSRRAEVTAVAVDLDRGVVTAEHDGYTRLEDPVVHRRHVEAPPDAGGGFLVVDVLRAAGEHTAGVAWPLAPGLQAQVVAGGHLVTDGAEALFALAAAATAPLRHTVVVGDPATHRGWVSRRLEGREPAPLLGTTATGTGPLVVATHLHPATGAGDLRPPVVEVDGDVARVVWWAGGRRRVTDVAITPRPPGIAR